MRKGASLITCLRARRRSATLSGDPRIGRRRSATTVRKKVPPGM
jgi:hypothetical protein